MDLNTFYSFFPPTENNVIKAGEVVVYISDDNVFAYALDKDNQMVPLTLSAKRLLNKLNEPEIQAIFTAPPAGNYPVVNLYVNPEGKLVVQYDDLH